MAPLRAQPTAGYKPMTEAALKQCSSHLNFTELYQSHYQLVKTIVSRFKFCDAAAEDLIQDIFLKAWQNRHQLKISAAFSGWLVAIARNCCLDEKRRAPCQISVNVTDCCKDDSSIILEAQDPAISMQIEVSHHHLQQLIEMHGHAVRRQVATMYYLGNQSCQEIAQVLDLNTNTVLSHLRRFRIITKEALLLVAEEQGWDLASC
jgi:RNA polymerase sigma-70 factor (ECF subfamily)